ncbi:DUF2256 domain-containing protein [Alteromonas aestuariivivens]|uniref:DUF2256 domain-containing protein n=1 Tax=Alteromonas aestuariivivens TaxID=1938339 RepID=A0A3D8MAA2_9ALTE|nr:DUF2256 domain-containing protein [Alteromonas aestuariivivens]RDV26608.1 DUF2256 domain-containing protein [Alteromonas aestuariivivens]
MLTDSKLCPVCQRPFENRKKWQSRNQWASIVYCSKRCRTQARSRTKSLPPEA